MLFKGRLNQIKLNKNIYIFGKVHLGKYLFFELMKRNTCGMQRGKHNTVTFSFRASQTSILNSQQIEGEEIFRGRTKRKQYPCLFKFKKLQKCSQQSKSQNDGSVKEFNKQKQGIFNSKKTYVTSLQKNNSTTYDTSRQYIHVRSSNKRKAIIPLQNQVERKAFNLKLFTTQRTSKSFQKVLQKGQVQKMSLKSLNVKYINLKRQASSLYTLPVNKINKSYLDKSPKNILIKQTNQLFQLQKQFRKILQTYKQQQQKKHTLCQLISAIKKQLSYENSDQQICQRSNINQKNVFKCTELPQKQNSVHLKRARIEHKPSTLQNSPIDIQKYNKIPNLRKKLIQIDKQKNQLKSIIGKMKSEVLLIRKDRVLYSGLCQKIQKQIKQEQKTFFKVLIQSRNRLGLAVDVKVASNQEELKTIVLKQYYYDQNNNISNSDKHTKKADCLKKKQSGMQDTFNIIRNYNSFSIANFSVFQYQDQNFNFPFDKCFGLSARPRKKTFSNQIFKRLADVTQMQKANIIEQCIEKMAIKLGITIQQWKLCNSEQKSNRKGSPPKHKQSGNSSSRRLNTTTFISSSNGFTQIVQQISCKNRSIQLENEKQIKRIQNIDREIFDFKKKIYDTRKININLLNQINYQFEQQCKRQKQEQRKLKNKDALNMYQSLFQQCFHTQSQTDFQFRRKQQKSKKIFYKQINQTSKDNRKLDNQDYKLLNFIDNLQLLYQQTKLSTLQFNVNSKDKCDSDQQDSQSIIHLVSDESIIQQIDVKSYVVEALLKSKTKEEEEQHNKQIQSKDLLTSVLSQSSDKPPAQRHQRGVNTLITKMSIFQSYQKAMSRKDFQNQYQKQVVLGKKKKTLLRRGNNVNPIN